MKSIEVLIWILKFFGWLAIIFGSLLFLQLLGPITNSLLVSLSNFQLIIGGVISLSLAKGLSKKEKWAFYTSFIIFSIFFLQYIIKFFYVEFSFVLIIVIVLEAFSLFLLIQGRQQFIEQPKEQISQWFRKPYFIIAIIGMLVSYTISGIVFILLKDTGVTILQLL